MMLAKSEACILREYICIEAYADEELIRILATRSKAQLNATLNQYNDQFGNAITKVCLMAFKDKFVMLHFSMSRYIVVNLGICPRYLLLEL